MYDWASIIQSAQAQGKSVYDWLIATGVGDNEAVAAIANAIGAGQLGQDQAYLPPSGWTTPTPTPTPPPPTTPPTPPPPPPTQPQEPILPIEGIKDGMEGGMPPIGQITPGEAFGYGTGQEFAGWLQRLQAGGMLGQSPAQQWAKQQYTPSSQNYWLANQLRMLQGQPEAEWGQAPFRSAIDPNLWNQVQGVQGTQAGQDWIGQMGGSEGYPLWNIGAASLGGGRVTPGTQWLQQQAGPQYWNWQAFDQPGVEGTTGTPWLDYIKGYMGI